MQFFASAASPLAPLQPVERGEGCYTTAMVTYKKMILSRLLRRRSTVTEKIAWNMLRDRRMFGHRFKRQLVIRGFVLDFYCYELRLAIEIDGPVHERQREYDAWRQSILESEDISFLRITTKELEESPEKLTQGIRAQIEKLRRNIPHPIPTSTGSARRVPP